jgi:adenine/guanine phosphoribosyltransferase-like PRPP-binding protein
LLLVDDVDTTGVTATGCAKVLRPAGAAKLGAATVARKLKLASKYEDIPEGFKFQRSQGLGAPYSVEVDDFPTLKR